MPGVSILLFYEEFINIVSRVERIARKRLFC